MPGPLIKFTPPDAANIASKFPEPLRKAGGAALQGLFDLVGADDPMTGLYPTPAISIYKDAAGIPSKALRAAGTKEFLESAMDPLRKLMNQDLPAAAQTFANKYPRIAAHLRINDDYLKSKFSVPEHPIQKPMNVSIGILSSNPLFDLTHEATHGAQALGGGPDVPRLWKAYYDRFVKPLMPENPADLHGPKLKQVNSVYGANPTEWSANWAAQKMDPAGAAFWREQGTIPENMTRPPGNSIQQLRQLLGPEQGGPSNAQWPKKTYK